MKKKQLIHDMGPENAERAYACILDMQKYGHYHPMMTSVEVVGRDEGGVTFEVKENAKLVGFIPMKPVYRATVTEIEKGKTIRYTSLVKKQVKLEIVFSVESTGKITEDITVWAPWPIASIFINLLQKMHLKVMDNMKNSSYQKK